MKATNDKVDQFIIDTLVINPIQEIINKLIKEDFRDCDIKWLDERLEEFTIIAGETIYIKIHNDLKNQGFTLFNKYVYDFYLTKFNILLEYFKTF
jgi:hypothetical protein